MNYGKVLLKLREEHNLKQNQVADILNIDHTQYSHYEVEYRTIPIKHLITLSDYYKVSLDYIFEFTDKKNYTNRISGINKKEAGIRLRNFRKANNLTQEKIATFLNTTKAVICNYEKGRNLISTPFLYQLCKKYNVSADYLLGKTDNPEYLNNY